ncbi:MAG TPA: HAMP domain-containing sensor histidine kinase [Azospirillaceae bacterium]|nr:HAMP domain-containing sensor histidine kinase [Azospirillaceae bacterium]
MLRSVDFVALARSLEADYSAQFARTRQKLRGVTLIGALGFPAYYWIWADLFPQPYENLALRLAGSLLCVGFWFLLARNAAPGTWRARLAPVYCYALIIYCLPFFFAFMALKNGFNAVWMGSAICAVLYLILLLDIRNMLAALGIGTVLALLAHALTGAGVEAPFLPADLLVFLPILAYALTGAVIYNYNEAVADEEARERLRALSGIGNTIAHEMRTPLLGIRFDLDGVRELWPDLAADASRNREPGIAAVEAALARMDLQLRHTTTVLDMLLMNVSEARQRPEDLATLSMAAVVDEALARYPFRGGERGLVTADTKADFAVRGSQVLLVHVLFNLLRNGLKAVAEAGGGAMHLRLEVDVDRGRLLVRDGGTGMAPEIAGRLFTPFVTSSRPGAGVGLGLAFCKRTVEGIGGRIRCQSAAGAGTEFTLEFPRADTRPS